MKLSKILSRRYINPFLRSGMNESILNDNFYRIFESHFQKLNNQCKPDPSLLWRHPNYSEKHNYPIVNGMWSCTTSHITQYPAYKPHVAWPSTINPVYMTLYTLSRYILSREHDPLHIIPCTWPSTHYPQKLDPLHIIPR